MATMASTITHRGMPKIFLARNPPLLELAELELAGGLRFELPALVLSATSRPSGWVPAVLEAAQQVHLPLRLAPGRGTCGNLAAMTDPVAAAAQPGHLH